MQQTLKNCDKELVIIKAWLIKVQYENQTSLVGWIRQKQVARKTKNLHQEYIELN